jgi:hypothetical protein
VTGRRRSIKDEILFPWRVSVPNKLTRWLRPAIYVISSAYEVKMMEATTYTYMVHAGIIKYPPLSIVVEFWCNS